MRQCIRLVDTVCLDAGAAGHAIAIENEAVFNLYLIEFEGLGVVER